MKRNLLLYTVLLLLMTTLTGCWDSQELEQRTSVVAIGIDRDSKNKNQYVATIQIPIPKKIMGGAGGGKEGQEAIRVMSATGKTFYEASDNLQKRLNQTIFYGHTRILVFSEQVAREGIEELMDPFRRSPQIRRRMWPMVVKGSARELLLSNNRLEQIPTVFIMDLLQNGVKRGYIPDISLGRVFSDLSDQSKEPSLIYVLSTRDEFKWNGLAVFRENKMVGTLTDEEVWSLMHIREQKKSGELDAPCGSQEGGDTKKLAIFRPKSIQVKKTFRPDGPDGYKAEYHVQLEGDIIEAGCEIDFFQSKNIAQLQKTLNKEAEIRARKMITKLQKELKSDVINLGSYVRGIYPQWWSEEKWEEVFPKGEIRVTYDVRIRRTGMETR